MTAPVKAKPATLPTFARDADILGKVIRMAKEGVAYSKIGEKLGISALTQQIAKVRSIAEDESPAVSPAEHELAGAIAAALPKNTARGRAATMRMDREECESLMDVVEEALSGDAAPA